jgi:hypothetical protein
MYRRLGGTKEALNEQRIISCVENVIKMMVVWVIKSRRVRWVGHVAHARKRRGAYKVLVGKSEGQKPLLRPRCRLEDNIKMYLQGVGWGDMDWIDSAQDMDSWWDVVNVVISLQVL